MSMTNDLMNEERREVQGYEGIYDISISGRIITRKTGLVHVRNGDPYGYARVHLYKNGERIAHRTFDLWKEAFRDTDPIAYKGMK